MFLTDVSSKKFGFSTSILKNDYVMSFGISGNYVLNDLVGPIGASSIDINKRVAFLKTYHETIEREALMLGSYEYNTSTNTTKTINLIDRKIYSLDLEKTKYSISKNTFSDTTGTGVNLNSSAAVYKALTELLEKNILFLFWYGHFGYRIPENYYTHLKEYNYFKIYNYTVKVFYIKGFNILNTFITFIMKDGKILSTGISGDIEWHEALRNSLKESRILLWQNIFIAQKNNESLSNNYTDVYSNELHDLFQSKPFYDLVEQPKSPSEKQDYSKKIQIILKALPDWINTIYISLLKNKNKAKCVLCYSEELFNGLPKKEYIDLNREINKKTVNLDKNKLKRSLECIVV